MFEWHIEGDRASLVHCGTTVVADLVMVGKMMFPEYFNLNSDGSRPPHRSLRHGVASCRICSPSPGHLSLDRIWNQNLEFFVSIQHSLLDTVNRQGAYGFMCGNEPSFKFWHHPYQPRCISRKGIVTRNMLFLLDDLIMTDSVDLFLDTVHECSASSCNGLYIDTSVR
jgi:hypothetical protein